MIKIHEIKSVIKEGGFHSFLMIYTAIMVPVTDFLTGVLSALIIFAVYNVVTKKKRVTAK
jgi:hypothetical protein